MRPPLQACEAGLSHPATGVPCLLLLMEDNLVITAIVADHTTSTPTPLVVLQQHPNFTMVDMGMITWVVMGLGCLVLSLCVLLASILIYQHCR